MFEQNYRAFGGAQHSQSPVAVTISTHAQEQWADRMPANISPETAWEQAVDVEAYAADCTSARLYPPHNALLTVKGTTVTTVLHNDGRLNTPGLIECASCGDLMDPVDHATCPWCDADSAGTTRPGRVTVTRGDI
jgi:hypothetical protein